MSDDEIIRSLRHKLNCVSEDLVRVMAERDALLESLEMLAMVPHNQESHADGRPGACPACVAQDAIDRVRPT